MHYNATRKKKVNKEHLKTLNVKYEKWPDFANIVVLIKS